MSSAAVVVGQQTPRIHVRPDYVSSAGQEAIEVAEVAGLHLDPWQKLVLTDALGETSEGRWAAYRVGLEVPRQNGKGGVLEARELAGLFAFGEKTIIHSAHEQATASEHFARMLALMEGVPEFDRRIMKVVRGKGQESIVLRDGYRIFFKTRTGGGGRGFTVHLLVLDEAMILASAFMSALLPTLSSAPDPQIWLAGSAVDRQNPKMDGVEFARVRADALKEAGRLAYFGWGAPFESPDKVPAAALDDPKMWAMANPALGIRIAPGYVADERSALGAREFCVERLGVGDWPSTETLDGRLFESGVWDERKDGMSRPQDPVCFAFSVTPDRARAAIGVAGRRADGSTHVGVVDARPGTKWVAERVAKLLGKHQNVGVVVNGKGQAPSLLPDLAARGVTAREATTGDVAQACGRFHGAVVNKTLWHTGAQALDAALDGAARRKLGEAWAWDHYASTTDISPLEAVTLALWGLDTSPPPSAPRLVSLDDI